MQTPTHEHPTPGRANGASCHPEPFPNHRILPAASQLLDALATMGLDKLEPAHISSDFYGALIDAAMSWKTAIAASTLASRQVDLRRFVRWCESQGRTPFSSVKALAELMETHAAEIARTLTPGTARRVGANLTALAKEVGSDRVSRGATERRRLAVRSAQKVGGARGKSHQKPRLSVSQMQALRSQIEASGALPLRQLRDLAIFDVMCDLLARRSEMVELRLRDLDLPGGTVRISHSKTDQGGRGAVFRISPRTVASLEAWLAGSSIPNLLVEEPGALPVFVGVMNDGSLRPGPEGAPSPLDGRTVARVLQRHTEPLGISGVAGHSLRRSMARALHEAGVPEDEIVKKGRWSSLEQMREYVGLTAPIQGASDLIF